ncbi:MAG: hypothetical protein QOH93_2613 [Chloroflexia bacterium]|nr:hypothetical protein [Chloroflexia bacterium]
MIKEPLITFTPWTSWPDRNLVKNAHLPGVYLLALFDDVPPRAADPLSRDLVYIGETADNSLMHRWQQFHRAAFEGKPGHSGGLAFHEIYGDEPEYASRLYVSAFVPEGLSRELRTLFILYVERKLLWDWARKWEAPPVCNTR